MRRILATIPVTVAIAVIVAVVLVVASGSGPASACSLVPRELSAPAEVTAGETLTVSGMRFFLIEGEIEPDCSGDFKLLPPEDASITAVFETASGKRTLTLDAPVSSGEAADDFTIGPVDFAVPDDARSVRLTSRPASNPLTVTVLSADPPPADPPPAKAVPAEPSYTG